MSLQRSKSPIVFAFFANTELLILKYPRKNHFFWGIFVTMMRRKQNNNQTDRLKSSLSIGLFFVFYFVSIVVSTAQSVKLPNCAFDSINVIQFPDTINAKPWIDNLKNALQNGNIQILHIGDSHVQSGAMSAATRAKLQKVYGDAGYGLLFPYAAAKTYSPRGYKSRYIGEFEFCKSFQPHPQFPMGLSGATVKTRNPKSLLRIFQLPALPLNTQYELTLWVPNTDSLYASVVRVGGKEIVLQKEVDSAHLSVARLIGTFPATDSFQIALKKTNSHQEYWMLYGMELRLLEEVGLLYHGAGMGGARIESVLNSSVVAAQIQDLSPQIVVVDLGTNDFVPLSQFPDKLEVQLKSLILKIKSAAPNAMVILVSPMDMYFHGKKVPHTFAYSQMLAAVAGEMHCGLWDWYWIAGANKAVSQWQQKKWLSSDGIHMTEPGYWVKGDLLAGALLDLIKSGLNADSLIAKNWLNYDSLWNLKYPSQKVLVKPRVVPVSGDLILPNMKGAKNRTTAVIKDKPNVIAKTTPTKVSKTKVESPFVNPKVAVNNSVQTPNLNRGSSGPPTVLKVMRHTVKAGETVQDLAFQYDVNAVDIKKWNGLSGNQITPGKTIVIRKMIPVGPRSR